MEESENECILYPKLLNRNRKNYEDNPTLCSESVALFIRVGCLCTRALFMTFPSLA